MLVLWVASAFVAPPARFWMWGVGILAETSLPFLNARAARRVPIDMTHIPERFGLFTLIVLGEVVVAVANGVAGADWRPASAFLAVFGFGIAAALWWINFEFVHTSRMSSQSTAGRHTFLYGHFVSTVGIVATGVGINHAIRAAGEVYLPVEVRLALCGGVALFLVAVAASHAAARCAYFLMARLGAACAVLALLALGGYVRPLALVGLLFGTLVVEAYLESRTSEAAAAEAEPPEVACTHLNWVRESTPATEGCAECLAGKEKWVHLRLCLTCGHVGCCDSSKHKHATRHYEQTGHPVMRSIEPGESWVWCYTDETFLAGEWITAWQGAADTADGSIASR
jgi:hypothetical protein